MLVGSLRKNNKNYYINLEQKDNKYYCYVVLTSNDGNYILNREDTIKLFNDIYKSRLSFFCKDDDYDVYIDEIGNKRYFKNNKEDFYKFYEVNGINSILYSSNNKINNNKNKIKYIRMKNMISLYKGFVAGFLIATISYAIAYPNENAPIQIDIDTSDGFALSINDDNLSAYINNDITVDEIKEYLLDSDDVNLDNKKKNYFINEDLFNDVLSTADKSRNYILRKKLKNFGIEYFNKDINIENSSLVGYYDLSDLNHIYLQDDSEKTFNYAAGHEFIHLLQDENDYLYIKEASAEIMRFEYYGGKITSYIEPIKRVYTLMEIIGPKTIMECNFKGDTTNFENAIKDNLGEEDGNKLLELFTKPPVYDDNQEKTNEEIKKLLAKMYKNVYKEDISNDELMNYINNDFLQYKKFNRIYFNKSNENYDKDFLFEYSHTEKLLFDSLENKDDCSFYCYYKHNISEDEYEKLQDDQKNDIYRNYDCVDGYIYDIDYDNIISSDGKKVYNIEEAKEKNLITKSYYCEVKTRRYNSYSDFLDSDQSYYNCIVVFKDNDFGKIVRNKNGELEFSHTVKIKEKVKPISEKFKEQVNIEKKLEL